MPSNPIEDALSGMDPIDAATLFAGLKPSVPLGMLFRSGELNANEDAELARRRPMAPTVTEPRPRTYEDEQRDFEAMFPDPTIRRAVLTELIAQRTQPYHPATATRRKDFEQAPEGTRHEARPLMKKAVGGAVDFTQPDMSDGGQILQDPHLYATGGTVQRFDKGGRAAKTLDEMVAEMAKKGVRMADKPDLSRRSLFGLGSQPTFPLANLDTKALQKMQAEMKGAPAVTEKSVTIDPGKGGVSETIRSVAETPMTRRSVLKSMAGQAAQHVLPKGALPSVLDAAEEVAQKAVTSAPAYTVVTEAMIPGIVAEGLKMGYSFPRIMKMIEGELGTGLKNVGPEDIERTYQNLLDPRSVATEFEHKVSPGEAWQSLTGVESAFGTPTSRLRQSMRSVKEADPELYNTLRDVSRDISQYGHEN